MIWFLIPNEQSGKDFDGESPLLFDLTIESKLKLPQKLDWVIQNVILQLT